MTNTKLTPKTANTTKKLVTLKRDNFHLPKSWILVEGNKVHICNQRNGEKSTGQATLSKKEFERFIKFYETGI